MVVALSAYMEWVSLLYGSHWLNSVECHLFKDASDKGFGCYFKGHWCQGKFPDTCFWDGLMSINWRELYTVTMALAIWGTSSGVRGSWYAMAMHLLCQIMAKHSSKSKSMMVLVCTLVMFGMQNNFNLCLQHIPGVNNGIADVLSRFNNDFLWQLTPDADFSMMLPVSFAYQ